MTGSGDLVALGVRSFVGTVNYLPSGSCRMRGYFIQECFVEVFPSPCSTPASSFGELRGGDELCSDRSNVVAYSQAGGSAGLAGRWPLASCPEDRLCPGRRARATLASAGAVQGRNRSQHFLQGRTGSRHSGLVGVELGEGRWTRRLQGTVVAPAHLRLVTAVGREPEHKDKSLGGRQRKVAADSGLVKAHWGSEQLAPSDPAFDMASVTQSTSGQLKVSVRVLYSLAMYGGMALLGKLICSAAGVDFGGGLRLDAEDFYSSILYALLPIFGSLVMSQDSVVESWAPARAIRDAEDEEAADFFVGMATWQYLLISVAAALAEELFFRSAVQGGLAHALQLSAKGTGESASGIAALTSVITTFSPCSQAIAAVLTAASTGSMFYIVSSPKDPKLVVAYGNPRDMTKSMEAWRERQKLRMIYSPLLESVLSLYLGFEWLATGNILAPMVTHALYYMSNVANGVRRVEDRQRADLRKKKKLIF